jgi:hypothetical protein
MIEYTNYEKAVREAYAELQKKHDNTTPKLDAATLPIGTVMVLGGNEFLMYHTVADRCWFKRGEGVETFSRREIQELIDRGVEFRIPEAKP